MVEKACRINVVRSILSDMFSADVREGMGVC